MLGEFLITSLIVVLLPGTGVLYTVARALAGGRGAGIWAASGCTLGILPHMLASIVGLAALLHASALAFEALRYLSVAFLLYLAWTSLRAGADLDAPETAERRGRRRIVLEAMLVNLLNPKLSVFFLGFLPLFVPTGAAAPTERMLVLSAAFMAMTFIVFVGYAVGAATARRALLRRPAAMLWLRRCCALGFGLMAIRLALQGR